MMNRAVSEEAGRDPCAQLCLQNISHIAELTDRLCLCVTWTTTMQGAAEARCEGWNQQMNGRLIPVRMENVAIFLISVLTLGSMRQS